MKMLAKRLSLIGLAVGIGALVISSTNVSAHVVVKPAEVLTASFQTFTVGVPNEKDIPTTSIKLDIPAGLKFVSPTQKAGWKIDLVKDGDDVKSITWMGGDIDVGLRDDFTFSAQVPAATTELHWKAYQTYSDGTVVSWDQAATDTEHSGADSGPFSVTKIVTESSADTAIKKAIQSADNAKAMADNALYVGVAGVLIGLAGVYFGTRKK